jgi:uncharacterized GH25 family protein
MKLIKSILLTCILLLVLPVLAHEFWLQPQQYIFSRGEEINIRFKVGEGFAGDNWTGNQQKVETLQMFYGDVSDNLFNAITNNSGDSLQFSLFEEATALVTFTNTDSFIELDATKFNEYLLEDGLTAAIDYRKQYNETDSVGRELYQRSVKTIVQVGTNKTDIYKKQTLLPIDIIPLSHPYALINNQLLTVKILYRGEPLANTKIRTWHKLLGTVTDSSFLSDANGEISFPVITNGEWMVSCVHMIRLTDNPKAQWQSYWGSVTWGYTGNTSPSKSPRRGD